jgi:hypothetical protein
MILGPFKFEGKAGPPAFLAAIVTALTPRSFRQTLAIELLSNYTTLASYCFNAVREIQRATAITGYKSLNWRRMTGDIACVFIAFHALPPPALAAILFITELTLLWRDAHMYPPESCPGEAATDAIILGSSLVGWQVICLLAAHSFTAPATEFFLGLFFAMAMVAGWRFTLRWETKDPTPSEAVRAYRDAWRIYVLWIAAVMALVVGNTRVVVGGDLRDFLCVAGPFVFFVVAARRQSDRIGGRLFDWALMSIGQDLEKVENAARATHLFTKRMKTWKEFSRTHLYEALFFISIALEIAIIPVAVLKHWIPADVVHWFLWSVEIAVFVTLARVWVEVKKIHERLAGVLLGKSS